MISERTIVSCTVEPPKHMYVFACQNPVLNSLKWRCGRPCYRHVRSLFANWIVAHLSLSAIDYCCTDAPVFDCGNERAGTGIYFWKCSASFLWDQCDSQSFLVCCFCSLICWEVFYSVEIFGLQVLRVKCNYIASILIKGSLAAWEHWVHGEDI